MPPVGFSGLNHPLALLSCQWKLIVNWKWFIWDLKLNMFSLYVVVKSAHLSFQWNIIVNWSELIFCQLQVQELNYDYDYDLKWIFATCSKRGRNTKRWQKEDLAGAILSVLPSYTRLAGLVTYHWSSSFLNLPACEQLNYNSTTEPIPPLFLFLSSW